MGNAVAALKTMHDVGRVAEELKKHRRSNLFYCLWVMQFESALRFSDATLLKWEDFAEGKTHINIVQQKTGNRVEIKITETMRKVVELRRAEAESRPLLNDYVFSLADLRSKGQPVSHNAVLEAFSSAGRRCGFKEVGSHTPRKSKGRVMFEAKKPIESICKYLGQKSVDSTLFYIGIDQEAKDILSDEFTLHF
ncbi:tyrosine-type recombinase/integrase [Pantoea sp. ME81]|uniref:tyrosine-type recombinase/integrase n=1 Tax=Pantoea sp. ME81 TaxID=2743935 RepID=UPI0015F450F9|nr:tyrosine-type recombinase/integrase [Pantoea sp. ME81]